MNNTITACTIQFEPNLPEKTKRVLITAINRFAGVRDVSVQYDTNPSDRRQLTSPAISATSAEHHRIPAPNALPPKIKPESQKNEAIKSTNIQAGSDYLQQRSLIDFAIKWGITTKKVNWETIQHLSPEQIVKKAFTLIKEMPDREVKKIEAYL